jgi:NAD(P)-dependent dehydrogenase (short-subunit alcohol dehydrogenase family)
MIFDFKGKNVLVTGGSRGIGAEIALNFYRAGAKVTITATSPKSAAEFAKSHELVGVDFIEIDFSDLKSTLDFSRTVSGKSFDILINNAGTNKIDSLEDITVQDWQRIQDVNLRGPFLASQALARGMIKKKWGRIVNISSVFGIVSKDKRLAYTTSKSGLIGMTKNMALELAPHNILVNAVSPGFIDTELTRSILGKDGVQEMISKVPLARLGQSQDVANLVLFLSSTSNNFITGENVVIDGGFTCA